MHNFEDLSTYLAEALLEIAGTDILVAGAVGTTHEHPYPLLKRFLAAIGTNAEERIAAALEPLLAELSAEARAPDEEAEAQRDRVDLMSEDEARRYRA